MKEKKQQIQMIPVHEVHILNPRVRNKKQYRDIAENVVQIGLKRPITVTSSKSNTPDKKYDLVCGQGRLEIFIACGQKEIPAIVIEASEEEAYLKSLVENLARRQHSPMDLMKGIELLRSDGYSITDISNKTGMAWPYVRDITNLIENGEERLVTAVETGMIPISLAALIASSPGEEQNALQEAYENKSLRGKKLLLAKKLIEERNRRGKAIRKGPATRKQRNVASAQDVVKAYKESVSRKRVLVRKSEMVNNNLLFIVEALRRLYGDDNFKNLLKAEGLTSMPKILSERLEHGGASRV